ncbi:MAG TPA: efflux RND transporter permease subunit [Terriglobia bacterium]|nr:efflux RND transporter permease subunit [Terriglobia bacterium]
MNVVRFCRRNSRAVYLLTALLVAAGAFSAFRLPSNIYPELTFPRIVILAQSGDLSPQNMLLTVTRPLEEAGRAVLGARRVSSKTIRGGAEISVLFNPDMDMQYALQLAQAQISEVRGQLPPQTEVSVERITPSTWPILMMILHGAVPASDLRDYAYYDLRPIFSRAPGVARVDVQGSEIREISVIVDPQKMLSHRLSLPEIADRLRATNDVASVGRLDKGNSRFLVLATAQFTNLEEIRNTVVALEDQSPIRLRDIAEVREGAQDPRILVFGNGQPGALISISRQIGGNILEVADQVKRLADNLGSAIPSTLHLTLVYDLAEFVREAVASILDAVLIGGLLAVLILFVFLREGRTTLIAAITLPVTVISTFFFLSIFGGTLNLMSLGGLAIAIGLVIDDAVVIIENIYRHLGLGESAAEAAEKATRELLGPVVGSTATTVVVFSPLSLLQGVVGEFFRALCLTLVVAVLLSLVFAVTLIPLLSERFLTARYHRASSSRFIEPVYRGYERMVRWSLRWRWTVAGAAVLSVALAAFLFYARIETGFLPEMDEGGFVLDTWTPPGTSLEETNRVDHLIEEEVRQTPEIASFLRRTGAEMGPFATEQNTGEIVAKLKPRSQRRRNIYATMEDLRERISKNVPEARVEFIQVLQDMIGDMEGNPSPVEVKLFGSDMPTLEKLAAEIGPKIREIPGIVDFAGPQKGNPEIVVHVDPVQAGRLGMTVDQVSQEVSAGLLGSTQTELRETDRTVGIRVRFPDAFRYDYANIRQFPIVTPGKLVVPLSALARIDQVQGQNQLLRENQRLMVDLTARLENRGLGGAIRDVSKVLDTVQFPVGTSYEIGGLYESQQSSFRELLAVLGLALAAVFIVLVVQFRAFAPSLIIMSAAPLSLLGVFTMLWLTGTALNVSSFMGIILMVGLVVKNGIILFEYVHKLWEEQGMPLSGALVAAGKIRVRPILMTTLCTLFGLLPLALGLGSGAELQKPLALAVIGGLSISTFITLLVMPVLYSLLEAKRA